MATLIPLCFGDPKMATLISFCLRDLANVHPQNTNQVPHKVIKVVLCP